MVCGNGKQDAEVRGQIAEVKTELAVEGSHFCNLTSYL